MATAVTNAANKSAEVNIKNYKKQIDALRKQLNKPTIVRDPARMQQIYDQIEEIKHKIEIESRQTKKAVPVSNAPMVGQRQVKKSKRHFTIY